ncbi:MAG: outer membrane beta-barrel protein [Tannerellaceae bacterium]|nr:outer membrane beta-barrel protein [Tannerellaceae bacterium]
MGYGLSADAKLEHLKACEEGKNKIELDHGYIGGGAIAGYAFNNGIFLQAGYQLSFDFSSGNNAGKMKTQTISLGVGYKFL